MNYKLLLAQAVADLHKTRLQRLYAEVRMTPGVHSHSMAVEICCDMATASAAEEGSPEYLRAVDWVWVMGIVSESLRTMLDQELGHTSKPWRVPSEPGFVAPEGPSIGGNRTIGFRVS